MRDRMVVTLAVAILSVILVLTLAPLVLMFYTSFKPTGTLLQRAEQVMVADFEVGKMNSIGGPLGSTTTVVWYLYETGFHRFDMGHASAVGYVLFVITMILSWVQIKAFKEENA